MDKIKNVNVVFFQLSDKESLTLVHTKVPVSIQPTFNQLVKKQAIIDTSITAGINIHISAYI